jgi:hypothetical protein
LPWRRLGRDGEVAPATLLSTTEIVVISVEADGTGGRAGSCTGGSVARLSPPWLPLTATA